MAIGLGVINILRVHGTAILRTRRGWVNSLALVLAFFLMLFVQGRDFVESEKSLAAWRGISMLGAFAEAIEAEKETRDPLPRINALRRALSEAEEGRGFLSLTGGGTPKETAARAFTAQLEEANRKAAALEAAYRDKPEGVNTKELQEDFSRTIAEATSAAQDLARMNYEGTSTKKISSLLENGFFFPLGAAMFSLLAFYIATAAYRSFRVKSMEAFVMMLAALLVMLGQIPHGPLYVWRGLPQLRLWLLENLSTPGLRAIYFGSAIAGLAMAVRMWLSLEKSPLASEDKE